MVVTGGPASIAFAASASSVRRRAGVARVLIQRAGRRGIACRRAAGISIAEVPAFAPSCAPPHAKIASANGAIDRATLRASVLRANFERNFRVRQTIS